MRIVMREIIAKYWCGTGTPSAEAVSTVAPQGIAVAGCGAPTPAVAGRVLEKTNPPYLRMAGSMSPLALPATDFLVRRADDAPDLDTCHLALHHKCKPLNEKGFFISYN